MRRLLAGALAVALAVLGLTFALAAGGKAAPKPGLAAALDRTERVPSQRYAIHARITQAGTPTTLHIRGRIGRGIVAVNLRLGELVLPDGTVVPGPRGALLLDGPFLYERAPSELVAPGGPPWLRLRVARLAPDSEDLRSVRVMTPGPLLAVLRAADISTPDADTRTFNGTVAYDEPAVRRIAKLIGSIEFRHLRISATLGADGLVHRIVLTGRTPDGASQLSLRAYFYGFGRPVHVTPPAPDTFTDDELVALRS